MLQVPPETGLVFSSIKYSKPLSDATLSKLLRELGIPAVPHGFRSSFRDWADRIKTDRRDALSLARLHQNGELTPVWVP